MKCLKVAKLNIYSFLIPDFRKEELMLTLRSKHLVLLCVLALLVVAVIPWPAQASDYGTTDLTFDSRGSAVSQLQQDLTTLGFYNCSIDGWFGPKTNDAAVNFQESQGLKTDGIVGPVTKTALNAALIGSGSTYTSSDSDYNSHEKPIVDSLRASYNGSLGEALVGRAIWYMEYGFMKYGHTKYATTGYIDCSNFVSLVYKDFGYSITSAARNYGTVGTTVQGVYSTRISGTSKYTLVGVDKLKPGDIFTFWNADRTGIGHVAIYMGKADGKPCIINTCKGRPTAIGIINSFSYWYGSSLKEVRRVLPSSAYASNAAINAGGPVIPEVYKITPDRKIVLPQYLKTGF